MLVLEFFKQVKSPGDAVPDGTQSRGLWFGGSHDVLLEIISAYWGRVTG